MARAFLFARNHDRSYNGLKGLTLMTALADSGAIITGSLVIILGADSLIAGRRRVETIAGADASTLRVHALLPSVFLR